MRSTSKPSGVGRPGSTSAPHADTVVLVLVPGSGDSVQALKAGVMEIPDIIVVNKKDHPLAATMMREIKAVLALAPADDWSVPVLATDALSGEGVEEFEAALLRHRRALEADGTLEVRRRRNLRNEVVTMA